MVTAESVQVRAEANVMLKSLEANIGINDDKTPFGISVP